MKVGLYFGTFNPIHIGHIIIANHIVENTDLDEIWMVVSPHNPHKKKSNLLDDYHRLQMVHLATESYDKIKYSDVEFSMSRPSYTVHTLAYLSEKYPQKKFTLIMGEDNLKTIHKWENYEMLIHSYDILVYPRLGEGNATEYSRVRILENVPLMNISSSHIRNQISKGYQVRPLLSLDVWRYLDEMNFYKK